MSIAIKARKKTIIQDIQTIVGEPLTQEEHGRLQSMSVNHLTMLRDYMKRAKGVFTQAAIARDRMGEAPRCTAVYENDGKRCVKPVGHDGLHLDDLGMTWDEPKARVETYDDHKVEWDGYEEMLPDNSQAVEENRRRVAAASDPEPLEQCTITKKGVRCQSELGHPGKHIANGEMWEAE